MRGTRTRPSSMQLRSGPRAGENMMNLPKSGLCKVWKIDDSQTMCTTAQEHSKCLEHTSERLKVSCTLPKVESPIFRLRGVLCTTLENDPRARELRAAFRPPRIPAVLYPRCRRPRVS